MDRLANYDIPAHNAEVQQCLKAYRDGRPYRTPVILGLATRFFIYNPEVNPARLSFREYSENPDKMFEFQLHWQRWQRFNVLQDAELGLPAKWFVYPDFQNYYEAAWFGCSVLYLDDQVPDTTPAFGDAPERVMEHGLPEPLGGLMARGVDWFEHMKQRAAHETYLGRPIEPVIPCTGTDGPLTVACNLFGPDVACELMAGEPERFHRLMQFITEATIRRLVALRKLSNIPVPQDGFYFADDSVAMISTAMYREHVLPYHQQLCAALATNAPRTIHLCGDSTRHFKTLRDELNVQTFDTGYPVDFGALRRELGPQVRIQGGPPIEFLRTATPAAVRERVRQILQTGILDGGLFTLREGNNMAPCTPLETMAALYQAGREFGAPA
ncbi:MAG: uroporphyrinogen decarboxylase family protein [Verrucomicrobiota bacterium]